MSRRFAQAALMAARAHAGQLRRGGNTPYINHPLAVAAKVAEVTEDDDVLCAAVLHDTVEDTDVTLEQIRAALGPRVAGIVGELTDPPAWDDLPTVERKARQAAEYRGASAEARTIKIADQWANVSDLAAGGAGRDAAWLRGYLETSAGVVAACRPAAPDLGAAFDAAAGRLDAFIAGLEA